MKTIFDLLRWLIALTILYLVANYSLVGILYVFEFIVRHLSYSHLLYVLLIIPALAIFSTLTWLILIVIFKLIIVFIVRQSISLAVVFGILFAISYIVFLILFWFGVIEMSWEECNYPTINKILFSLLIGGFAFSLPSALYGSIKEDVK